MSQPPPPGKRVPNAGFQAAAARHRAFKATTEGQEANRNIRRFLDTLGSTWGYVIYRTAFSAESDQNLPLAMEKLNAFVRKDVESDLAGKNLDSSVNARVMEKWSTPIVEMRSAIEDAVSFDAIREAYLKTGRGQIVGDRGVCMVLGEKEMRSLIDGNVEAEFSTSEHAGVYVTVVDGRWVPGTGDPAYPGWMRVHVEALMGLYDILGTCSLYQSWSFVRERAGDGAFVYYG